MKGLTDIEGVLVGHATDHEGLTGCTAILLESGSVAGIDVRGSATGSVEWQVLAADHVTDQIHAIVFAGGSAFGLEASCGVRNYLAAKGVGFRAGNNVVPLVPGAILFDLGISKRRPSREMGEAAAKTANAGPVQEGCVGAGTGATVGKIHGLARAMKSGVGSATVWLDGPYSGIRVSALAAVNAFGDVRDPESGQILAGARVSENSMDFADTALELKRGARARSALQNTTLVAVGTDARLNKVQAAKLAQLASAGVARTLNPPWSIYDGDVTIGFSYGAKTCDINALGAAAAEAVAASIVRAVSLSASRADLPGLAG
jgi:L-aminopeptidase/D-esterase-like protein